MINALIKRSLRNRFLVLGATLLLFGWGLFAIRRVPIDAIPDLSENQVIVFADWEGRSPREVEDQVTYPLSVNLQGLAGVRTVRATSMFGFSLITVIFEDKLDNYFARTRVLERLNYLGNLLPAGVTPRLGPDATGLGWVYQYYLKDTSGKQDLGSLRALQDYFVRYQLAAVPGVAEVASIGGFVRQWQVEVSSLRMKQLGVSLEMVMAAIGKNNLNVGGRTVEENGLEFIVRGRGLITSAGDLETIALASRNGTPVYLRDIATVQIGGDYRRGVLDVDGHEVVGGTVVMRTGENAYQVIQDIKAKIAQISSGLPPGITIEPFYDRSSLIDRAIETLKHTLWEAVILVTLMHVIFLFHFRSILIVTLPLPASILVAFILMKEFGIQSHIMSLTGIAIAIGVLVDAAIVMTENVIRHCEQALTAKRCRAGSPNPASPPIDLTPRETWEITLAASQQVGRPIFFAMGIIILAFIPIFQLTGQEGKLFHPLAWTKTFAMIGATVLAVTLVPVLCTFLVRGPFHAEDRNWVMRALMAVYDPVLDWALRCRKTVLTLAATLLLFCTILAFGLPDRLVSQLSALNPQLAAKLPRGFGSEFMPTLQEGSLLFMPVLLPSTSLTEIKRIMAWQDRVIRETPEVASVAGKLGRFETATDPAPTEMIETTIMLKPAAEWRTGMTKEKLIDELTAKLTQVPGYVPGFLQPIENRILMLATGIRAQLGIKIFGDDLDALQKKAFEMEQIVNKIPGATGVAPSRVAGKPYLEISPDRAALARYGLSLADVLEVVETGIGGKNITTAIQGRERWPVQVRFERANREDLDRLGALPVAIPGSEPARFVPLGQIATIQRVLGPNEIASENGRLRVYVQANVADRDLGSFVDDAKVAIARDLKLDPGMTVEWSGQYENQLRARATLRLIMPIVLVIIFVILAMTFHSAAEAAHVILAVPFALTGGVLLQWFMGFNFSVAVWVGYIALFGTAIQTGVVMVVYLEDAVKNALAEKRARLAAPEAQLTHDELLSSIKAGARLRLRPKVMTVATAIAGLLPIFWSTRTGVEVMQPLAAPVVGGMLSSLVHILVVTPVIFAWLRERELPKLTA
jgi:Cu(I)/Ag(I) efflux system membrane protein CusA/SilA